MIFGAGVTGLSAAHELAQRGFRVLVVERDGDERDPAKPALGGMARSQFNRANPVPFRKWARGAAVPGAMVDVQDLWDKDSPTARVEGTVLEFRRSDVLLTPASNAKLGALQADFLELLKAYKVAANQGEKLPIHVWARTEPGESLPLSATVADKAYADVHSVSFALALSRSRKIQQLLDPQINLANIWRTSQVPPLLKVQVDWQILTPELDSSGEGPDSDFVGTRRGCGGVLLDDLLLPGEHGYRLFPRFYRNLLDTMKRTPILGEAPSGSRDRVVARGVDGESPTTDKVVEPHTVFDMLRSIEHHAFAPEADPSGQGGPPPRLMLRTRPKSWEDTVEAIRAQYEDLDWVSADMARYTVKVLQYMTSCKARRAEYSKDSWFDYLDGNSGSPGFIHSLQHWPKALVGLDSQTADARSFGSVSMQIMLDHTRPDGFRDGSLKGPTTEVWFDHWKTYLEDMGVKFVKGTLLSMQESGLYTDPNPVSVGAMNVHSIEFKVKDTGPGWAAGHGPFAMALGGNKYLCNAFMLLALPLLETQDLCRGLIGQASGARKASLVSAVDPWFHDPADPSAPVLTSDIQRIADWAIADPTSGGNLRWDPNYPQSPLRHFPGVQFYFRHDYALVPGHTYFPDSRWGLSTISQTQYRARRPGAREGYVGLMSVVIGDPNNDSTAPLDRFFDLTRRQVAEQVLLDIREGLEWGHMTLPEPVAFHVDTNLVYNPATGKFSHNKTPFLTAKKGEWGGRPGRLDDPELWERAVAAASNDTHPGYDVYFGRLVFAGNHMKTFTRLSTMESANESARHAVNGILSLYAKAGMTVSHDDLSSGAFVRVFDLEDDEVDDFLFLKQLDCELLKLGLPHFVEILGLSAVATALVPGAGSSDPIGQLLSALTNTTQTASSAQQIANLINVILGPGVVPGGARGIERCAARCASRVRKAVRSRRSAS